VIVGNNFGGPTDKPLRRAEEDASKMADVLAQLGDVRADDLFLLRGRGHADLQSAGGAGGVPGQVLRRR